MIRPLLAIATLALTAILGGCSSASMTINIPLAEAARPNAGEATIIFMRPSRHGFGDDAPIVEAGSTIRFVGVADTREAVIDKVTPGKHQFVVGGLGQNLLTANVEAGHVYFVWVRPYRNFLYTGFVLEPARGLGPKTYARLKNVKVAIPAPKTANAVMPEMREKVKSALDGLSSREAFVMHPTDGVPYSEFYRMMK